MLPIAENKIQINNLINIFHPAAQKNVKTIWVAIVTIVYNKRRKDIYTQKHLSLDCAVSHVFY